MSINDFIKKIGQDIKENQKEYTSDDFYYMLKYTGIKKDTSLVDEIDAFYEEFLETLNNSLIKYKINSTNKNDNKTNYIGFNVEGKANYLKSIKVYFSVKYEYVISALKNVFMYIIRNNIEAVVKFHEKATNENIVIHFYNKDDVIPFINYCNNSFELSDLVEPVNPFIATIYGIGIVKDANTYSYNNTLSEALDDYFNYVKEVNTLDKVSDLDFLDFIIKSQTIEEDSSKIFNLKAIEDNIKAIISESSPI